MSGTRNVYAFLNKRRGRSGRKPVRTEGKDSNQPGRPERVRAKRKGEGGEGRFANFCFV